MRRLPPERGERLYEGDPDVEDAQKKIQELLTAARTLIEQAKEIAWANSLKFDFGPLGWSPDEENLEMEISVEWQPSGGYMC